MKFFDSEPARFLVAGAINTALGYLLYVAALQVLTYPVAYTTSYVFGIFVSYALSTWFVFRKRWDWKRLVAFPLVYLLQYAFGLGLLFLFVERMGLPQVYAPLLVVVFTIPATFFASRFIIKGGA